MATPTRPDYVAMMRKAVIDNQLRTASCLASVSIAESLVEIVEMKREQLERERYYAEMEGEMFPDRPIENTPPL